MKKHSYVCSLSSVGTGVCCQTVGGALADSQIFRNTVTYNDDLYLYMQEVVPVNVIHFELRNSLS